MKRKVVHMIKPGKTVNALWLVEAFCALVDVNILATTINPTEATCPKCCSLMSKYQKKFAQNENLRKTQEG